MIPQILQKVKDDFGYKIVTDVHESTQVAQVAEVVDMLQIPAFLCRQTDLLVACAKTDKIVNIKKGQFLAPWDMQHVVNKARAAGNQQIMVCERGASFGYNYLVSDMRSLVVMQETGCPVVFDATHSVQMPASGAASSGGDASFVPYLSRAAAAVGVDGFFFETHFDPSIALSDGPNMIELTKLEALLKQIEAIQTIVE